MREDGQPALTEVEVLERRGALSLVRCAPRTGRTHQIRVHLAHLGFPILGTRSTGRTPRSSCPSTRTAAWRTSTRAWATRATACTRPSW
ncbi:MAG: RNA pseudouridine synthase [Alphaproteobacteria bacterium]|nr:RNA pseudouridine synthase [Alphaproteobacteria bacterium]